MKFLTKEVKIGLTGVAALAVLYLGMSFLKGMSFTPSHYYYITFANAKGLATSSPVYADGYQIGIVRDITYDFDKPGEVLVEISVDSDVRMPVGTKASLAEGMLGGCTLNLKMGTNPKESIAVGDTIKGDDSDGLFEQVAKVMPEVGQVLEHVDSLILTLNTLAANPDLQQTLNNMQQLTANANLLATNLNNSSEQLNMLLKHDVGGGGDTFDQAVKNVTQLTGNLASLDMKQTLDQVNQTIGEVQNLIELMQDPSGNLGLLLKDTAVYHNLNSTIQSANNLLIDLKEHPKRYVHFSVFGKKDK